MRLWRNLSYASRTARRVWACGTRHDQLAIRNEYCTCPVGMKVTICGAAGCTGQPLALLLKQSPLIDEIALYDQCYTCGYGVELSHVDTKCKVTSYSGKHMLCNALQGSKVVVIVARDKKDTFESNAPIVTEIALQICNTCPSCFTIVATEPIESMVPLVAEIQRLRGVYNPRALLGCIELNCVRANTVLADYLRVPPESVRVPVIGGATSTTMVPVISSSIHPGVLTQEQVECVTSCIMSGHEVVCAAKGCSTATACLAGAFAIARNTINVVKGLKGKKNIQCAYVDSLGTCAPECQFFVNDVYTMCQQCCSRTYEDPRLCYSTPVCPCVPPTNWTCEWPDATRDEYLASICKEMTSKCGGTELYWKPQEVEYDAARATNLTNQIPSKSTPCSICNVPRSVRIEQEMRDRAMHPDKNKCD